MNSNRTLWEIFVCVILVAAAMPAQRTAWANYSRHESGFVFLGHSDEVGMIVRMIKALSE